MNTEELEQIVREGQKCNTASLTVVLADRQMTVQNPSFQLEKLTQLALAPYHSRIETPSHAAHLLWKERTAGSLSLDKNRR